VIETWTDPRWLEDADDWIRAHVEPTAPIEQPHVRPWSTVLRVPTRDGDRFFKANAPPFAHEAAILEQLVPLAPGLLPELVAVDPDRRWFLLGDAGERVREREGDAPWRDVLADYAELQAAAAPLADELVAAGVPDRRLDALPDVYESLGGDRRVVEELCAELAAFALPETIEHDDLHDGQVFVRGGEARILDWGDACVAHPFLSLGIAAYFADEGATDAYLARWGDPVELRAVVPAARRLAGVARAATWAVVAAIAPPDWQERLGPGLPMWIERVATPPELWDSDF
jgi:hypothetical protein